MWERLILALHRSGRVGDAIDRLAAVRRLLRDDLAVRPGPALVELETMVLDRDSRLDLGQSDRGALSEIRPVLAGPGRALPAAHVLVGRDSLFEELAASVDGSRLTTLFGPGGVGKSSLAIGVATTRVVAYADGVWFVDLSVIGSPNAVVSQFAEAFGMKTTDGSPTAADVASLLAGRSLLVVIDNCDHVVAAVAELTALIVERCPAVTVVATSRVPLQLTEETVFAVPPLDATHGVELLGACARRVGVAVDSGDPAASALCALVDGLPLGIELVAARLRSATVSEIVNQLGPADIARLEQRGRPHRQRSLTNTIAWSYQRLDAMHARLLSAMSVFDGGASAEMVIAVCGPVAAGPGSVEAILDELVVGSLVRVERPDGRTRYRLLDTVRAYARQQLDDDNAAEVHRRLVHYMIDWAHRCQIASEGPDPARAFQDVVNESGNLHASFRWAAAIGAHRLVAELVAALGATLTRYSTAIRDLGQWVQIAVDTPGLPDDVRCDVLTIAAWAVTTDDGTRRQLAIEAAEVAGRLDDDRRRTLAQFILAEYTVEPVLRRRQDALFREAIELGETAGAYCAAGAPLLYLAAQLIREHRLDEAAALLIPRLGSRAGRYSTMAPFLLYQLARLRALQGRLDDAQRVYDAALTDVTQTDISLGWVAFGQGHLALLRNDHQQARQWFERSLVIDEQLGDHVEIIADLHHLITVCLGLGDLNAASRHARQLDQLAQLHPSVRAESFRAMADAQIAVANHDLDAACVHLVDGISALAHSDFTVYLTEALEIAKAIIPAGAHAALAELTANARDQTLTTAAAATAALELLAATK